MITIIKDSILSNQPEWLRPSIFLVQYIFTARTSLFETKDCNETIAATLSYDEAYEALKSFDSEKKKDIKYKALRIMKTTPGQEEFKLVFYQDVKK